MSAAESVVAVCNLKGGTGKTTSAVHLAHVWAAEGRSVLLVDADPQGSALRWSELATWPFAAIGLPVRDLYRRLPDVAGQRYDVVVVDTPPLDEQGGIVRGALRAATHAVVTTAPTAIEYERLAPVWATVDELEPLRAEPLAVAVLLTRVVSRAASTTVYRELIEEAGHRVLTAAIPRREAYAQAYGQDVITAGPYADAADELLGGAA